MLCKIFTAVTVYNKVSPKKKLNNNEAPGNPTVSWFTISSKFTAEDTKVNALVKETNHIQASKSASIYIYI
jgi:hypothetical protein